MMGRAYYAHRLAYEMLIGPIPDGLVIDHLCANKPCCNPYHMEPVTIGENRRRAPVAGPAAIHKVKTHCINGHELTTENIYVYGRPGHSPGRFCRICRADRRKTYRERVRADI